MKQKLVLPPGKLIREKKSGVFFLKKKYQQRKKQNAKESPLFISSMENSPSDTLLKIANMSDEHHKGIDIPAIRPKGSVKIHRYIT